MGLLVERRISDLRLQRIQLGLQFFQQGRQRIQLALQFVAQLWLACRGRSGRRGCRLRLDSGCGLRLRLFAPLGQLVNAAALAQPVGISANVLAHTTLALKHQAAGDHVIQERPVVADDQHGAVKAGQHILQQFQGFHIQVVGRLVEHQHVRRFAEKTRQQQTGALTTRQRLDRRARTLSRKQKITEVTDNVPAIAVDLDKIATLGDVVDYGLFRIQLITQLVKIGDFQSRAAMNTAAGGLQLAEQQLEQRTLARAVVADKADAVTANHVQSQVTHQRRLVRPGKVDRLGLDHALAGGFCGLQLEARLALTLNSLGTFFTHGLERTHAPFVTGSARLDALTNPGFFLRQLLVEQRVGGGFGSQLLLLVLQKAAVVTLPVDQLAAIQLQNPGCQRLQERTVVGNKQHRTTKLQQHRLQPGNGMDIQVVGRLIQQQHIRLGNQRLGQQYAAAPATGQLGHLLVGGQAESCQRGIDQLIQPPAVFCFELNLHFLQPSQLRITHIAGDQVVVLGQQLTHPGKAGGNHVIHRLVVSCRQLLRQLANFQTRRKPDVALICPLLAGHQPKQAGLAGAIATDQTHALATVELKAHLVEQRIEAVGQGYIREREQRHNSPVGLQAA